MRLSRLESIDARGNPTAVTFKDYMLPALDKRALPPDSVCTAIIPAGEP